MAEKKKTRRDIAEIARDIVERATDSALTGGELPATEPAPPDSQAVERGRKGGKAGGPARAARLSPEQRREIAQKAAKARWHDHDIK